MKTEVRKEILDLCDICGKTRVLSEAKDEKGEQLYVCRECKGELNNDKV